MIKVLDRVVIDKIAAGEVIERPASIVKELVENSVDSGASMVTVEIKDGGKELIRVTDNGMGIEASEVPVAFARHATSKLSVVEDLENIDTLGFRGEALSSISAVTETEMITKTRESMEGTKYVIHGGREIERVSIGAPEGTTIICRNLFYNTPARLKFLKTGMTEASYINDIVSRIALSHPDISFKFINNGRIVIDTSGNGKLSDVIYSIYGKDISKNLLPVSYSDDNGISISGYVGKPFICKGNRSFETYFVNKRYISQSLVNRAIEEAYKTYIMIHKFPFTVLFIDVDQSMCDINIHPAKREFKYGDEKALFSAVYHSVFDAISDKVHIPDASEDYRLSSAPKAIAEVNEPSGFNRFNAASKTADNSVKTQNNSQNNTLNNTLNNTQNIKHNNSQSVGIGGLKKESADGYSILEKLLPQSYRDRLSEKDDIAAKPDAAAKPDVAANPDATEKKEFASKNDYSVNTNAKVTYEQQTLADERYLSEAAKPKIKIIGQVFDTYWITQYEDTMFLMDQHAAHEKVNYERFLKDFKKREIISQNLMPPEVITLSPVEKTAVLGNLEKLQSTGFEVEDFGGNEVILKTIPINMVGLSGRDIFLEITDYLSKGIDNVTEDIFVRKIATMGCKAAIKGNQRISLSEAETLIEELFTLENPYTCPHGRPTIIKVTKTELEKKFKRITE